MTQHTIDANQNLSSELDKFNGLIVEWAVDKGIIEKNQPLSQNAKTMEEIVEMHDAMNLLTYATTADQITQANHGLKDAIGDVYVTLVIQAYMQINAGKTNAEALSVINNISKCCCTVFDCELLDVISSDGNVAITITSLIVDLMQATNEFHFSIIGNEWSLKDEFVQALEILLDIATLADLSFIECVDQAYFYRMCGSSIWRDRQKNWHND